MFLTGSLHNSAFVGIFVEANEELAVVPKDLSETEVASVEKALEVTVYKTMLGGSALIGSLMVLNNNGLIVTDFADREELRFFKDYNILFIRDRLNAVGNDILANDVAALVHPEFDNRSVKEIADTLGVEVIKKDLGGIKTVGTAGIVTKHGMLVNPQVPDEELKFLSNFFKIPVSIATANFGSLFLGASVVANSHGALIGELSTTIEIDKISDFL